MAKRKRNTVPKAYPDPEKNPEYNPDIIPDEEEVKTDEEASDFIYDDDNDESLPPYEVPSPAEGP